MFVFAVTQLSHGLLEHLTPLGAVQTAVLMLAVWWAWIDTAWITNWLDPDRTAVRLMLFALMLAGLVLSASIPKAFEDRALPFALAYAVDAGRAQPVHALGARRTTTPAISAISSASSSGRPLSALLWIAGASCRRPEPAGAVGGRGRHRNRRADGRLLGAGARPLGHHRLGGRRRHMAERCALFVIIALGESVLVTGATFAGLPWTAAHIGAFLVAFAGSVAMWVIYFNIGAERASRLIASSDDPGRLARNGYTYLHILIVAGIIVAAVGDDLALHHPGGHNDIVTAAPC